MPELKPCPAGKCDAQISCVGELVFCPKCGARNPNFQLKTVLPRVSGIKQQPDINLETGVVMW